MGRWNMIIQIRGTSGSGKSTIVREIMGLYASQKPVHREGRKQPLYYRLKHSDYKHADLAVLGHYEPKPDGSPNQCGGCDTISTPGQSFQIIFDLVRRNYVEGRDVLFEGLLISADIRWMAGLKEINPLVIELTTPLQECLDSVNGRRKNRLESAGKEFSPVNPLNTSNKHKGIQRADARLAMDHEIKVEYHDRASALARVRELLYV